ncbi:unnamed protein product [Notodromas monacha]|uniref:Trafficking protein particle complex subunit 9 n=1 Tax=Notodromas monacha TaxID=399045 RepID=A0A7R9BU26_9CRUS|nr:unnamed protein product [Notodromas monacha]CAG0920364.1 unnamed protein product [Notodromas monacha]
MRSSVSVILSSAPPDNTMSFPDYLQTAADHATLLILVRQVGQQLKQKTFNRFFETIQRIREIKVTDHQGNLRILHFRYKRSYPVENNEWGDFQTHRRVLGLLSLGKFTSKEELRELLQQHEAIKLRYASSLYDSRCVMFGDGTGLIRNGEEAESEFKSAKINYPSVDCCDSLLADVTEFLSSLFWVLESKRVSSQGHEKVAASEKLAALASGSNPVNSSQLICAPFERKDFAGIDIESRSNKKRCLGRAKKQQADLCLQAGLPFDAMVQYNAAAELLRGANDWLWLGGALEGMGAAAGMLHYPSLGRFPSPGLHRNSSFSIGDQGVPKPLIISQTRDPVSTQLSGNVPTPSEIIELYREAITQYGKYRHAGIIETEASLKAVQILVLQDKPIIAAEFLQNVVFINLQLPEEEKFTAFICHPTFQNSWSEAVTAHVLFLMESTVQVPRSRLEFFVQVQRFVTLAGLYEEIGFIRKASFYRRVAAMRCVSPQNTNPSWNDCYQLLVQCLDGYRLSLDPASSGPQITPSHVNVWTERNFPNCVGWPHLQTKVLEELIGSARRMGNNALAIRHMIFLLHVMVGHSPLKELQDHAMQLAALTRIDAGELSGILPVPLALDSGVIIPPVHLTNLPFVRMFDMTPPTATALVEKSSKMRKKAKQLGKYIGSDEDEFSASPFIVSNLRMVGSAQKKRNREASETEFFWVVDEICCVTMDFENPLPMDLHVHKLVGLMFGSTPDFGLLTEGVQFEAETVDLVMSPLSDVSLCLRGVPRCAGKLRILGYTLTTLGVTSNCKLRNMANIGGVERPFLEVDIVPELPMLEVTAFQGTHQGDDISCYPESLESHSPLARSLKINMFAGEKQEVKLKLRNVSKIPVEAVNSALETVGNPANAASHKKFISWDEEKVLEQRLPIDPDGCLEVVLSLDSNAFNFIGPPILGDTMSSISLTSEPGSAPSSLAIPSWLMNFPKPRNLDGGTFSDPLLNPGNRSLVSQRYKSTSSLKSEECSHLQGRSKVISVVLQMDYSGGRGFTEGYCRKWSMAVSLHILPSVCVTAWDILPGGTSESCYLVLDVQNATNQEMELTYKAPNEKKIAIEPLDSCRFPIPVSRCALNKTGSKELKSPEEEEAAVAKLIGDHLTSTVELSWVLPYSDIRGQGNLRGITLTPSMISLVQMPPVTWREFFFSFLSKTRIFSSWPLKEVFSLKLCIASPELSGDVMPVCESHG